MIGELANCKNPEPDVLFEEIRQLVANAEKQARIETAKHICDDLKDNTYVYWGDGSPSDLVGYLYNYITKLEQS